MTSILRITGNKEADKKHIEKAAAVLRTGGVVGLPTETVYGLAANALNPSAIARIYAAKGRPSTNPLIVHVTSVDAAKKLCSIWPDIAEKLAKEFWPGPLTLIVPKSDIVPDAVTAGLSSVAIRIPSHAVMRAVIDASQVPLAAPSANKFQGLSPTDANHVYESLGDSIDMILDAGSTEHGLESTVIDCTGTSPCIMRPGPITIDDISRITGPILMKHDTVDDTHARSSPGQSRKHYVPKAHLILAPSHVLMTATKNADATVAVLYITQKPNNEKIESIQMPADPRAYGAILYAELHKLDYAGMKTVFIEQPPDTSLWAAVNDRLRRASY